MFLTKEAALLVYKNMILPILEYGDIFMSAASLENRKKCQIVQNKALRFVHRVDKFNGSDLIYLESKLLKLRYRREQHLLHFTYGKRTTFKDLRRVSGVTTRAGLKNNFVLRKPNTEKFKRTASYMSPKLWNSVSSANQSMDNKALFKARILPFIKAKAGFTQEVDPP